VRRLFIRDDPQKLWSEFIKKQNISFAFNSGELNALDINPQDKEGLKSSFGIYSSKSCIFIDPVQYDSNRDFIVEMPSHSMVETLFSYKPLISNSLGIIAPDELLYKDRGNIYDPFNPLAYTEDEEDYLMDLLQSDPDLELFSDEKFYLVDADGNCLTEIKSSRDYDKISKIMLEGERGEDSLSIVYISESLDIINARLTGLLEQKELIRLNFENNKMIEKLINLSRKDEFFKPFGVLRIEKPWQNSIPLEKCVDFRLNHETEYDRFQSAFFDMFINGLLVESDNRLLLTLEEIDHEIQELNLKYNTFRKQRRKEGTVILTGLLTTLSVMLLAPEDQQKDIIDLLGSLSAYKGVSFISKNDIPEDIMNSPFWLPWHIRYR